MEKAFEVQAISPLDGRYHSKIKNLNEHSSEFALIRYRVQVEVEWLIALSLKPEIDCIEKLASEKIEQLRDIYRKFSPEDALKVKDVERITNHDVKAVEYFVNEKLTQSDLEPLIPMVHFACTSEDINNLSYGLMTKRLLSDAVIPLCEKVIAEINAKAEEYRKVPMMARTHGQPASPTTMGKEFHNVSQRLKRQLDQIKKQPVLGKINGAVGNFNAHLVSFPKVDWREFGRNFVESLGLEWNPATTQIEPHDYMAEIFHQMVRWNTIMIDFNRDIWSYISNEAFIQIPVKDQVGSSTMPHKINPIDFENSEGNLGIANAVFEHLAAKLPISRWQRDLTDSTVLRNTGVGFGYSMIAYQATLKGLSKLKINAESLEKELSEAWLLLGEALQTVMRKYKIPEPYEKMKALTRGKTVDQKTLVDFVENLDLPQTVKEELTQLTPLTYLGYAKEF